MIESTNEGSELFDSFLSGLSDLIASFFENLGAFPVSSILNPTQISLLTGNYHLFNFKAQIFSSNRFMTFLTSIGAIKLLCQSVR